MEPSEAYHTIIMNMVLCTIYSNGQRKKREYGDGYTPILQGVRHESSKDLLTLHLYLSVGNTGIVDSDNQIGIYWSKISIPSYDF